MTDKIPIRIVQTQDIHNTKKISILVDLAYYISNSSALEKNVEKFKKRYLDAIQSAKQLFYKMPMEEKKHQERPSSLYWELGNLINTFNNDVEAKFEILNYKEAVSRDFGLSKSYIYDLATVAKICKKSEIIDSVSFSYYKELKRKHTMLRRLGLFEEEIKRLNGLGKANSLPGSKKYRKQLTETIRNATSNLKKQTSTM